MEVYSVGPDKIYDDDMEGMTYEWLVYEYTVGDYCGDGYAIGFDGEKLWSHNLEHCSCFGPEEGLQYHPVLIQLSDLEASDNVLDPDYEPALVAKVKELLSVD